MKITTKMSRATAQIESMFKALNEQLFDSQLPTPILYFYDQHQSHTSAEERWDSHGEPCYEIGLSINKIALPIESLAAELLHEMIHLYCRENGIKDTSRGGTYHNRQFKEVAENYGLICEKDERRGWTTAPSDELIELVADYAWHEIRITREIRDAEPFSDKQHNKTLYVYACPHCGPRLRALRNVHFVCMCGEKLIRLRPDALLSQ